VTEGDIKRYLDTLRQHATPRSKRSPQLSEATINRRMTPLRRLFGRLQRYGMITINPMDDIKPANLGNISATVYLTRSQARRLLDTCVEPPITLREQRDHAIMALMLKTGLRSSEVLGLQVADLAVVEGHAVAWVMRKGQKRGRIKLGREVRQLIQVYLDAAGVTSGPIFRRLIAAQQPRRRLTPGQTVPGGRAVGLRRLALSPEAALQGRWAECAAVAPQPAPQLHYPGLAGWGEAGAGPTRSRAQQSRDYDALCPWVG